MARFVSLTGRLALGENGTAFTNVGGKVVSFDTASGTVHWIWQPESGFPVMVASTAGNGLVAAAFFQDGTHRIARLDSTGQPTFDDWTWTGGLIQYAFGDMWLAQGSVEAIFAPGLLWPFSVWAKSNGEPTRTSKRKIKLEVFEVESATATQDFIQQRVNSGIDIRNCFCVVPR